MYISWKNVGLMKTCIQQFPRFLNLLGFVLIQGLGVLLMMVGLPGSGKSTFARQLTQSPRWVRINQDSINKGKKGTKLQCLNATSSALKDRKWCIVDRMNATAGIVLVCVLWFNLN